MNENNVVSELQSASEWLKEHGRGTNTAIIGICDRAIDHINRQKTEIERLKAEAQIDESEMKCTRWHRDNARAEAVKEFAEMVKETAVTNITIGGSTYYCVGLHHLDNLVKEFTEGKENEPPKVSE